MSDAARQILVLTKSDDEPGNYDEGCIGCLGFDRSVSP
jgi:hypothetical protein